MPVVSPNMDPLAPDQLAEILCTPVTIGKLTLRNRLIMGPMAANAPNGDGSPSAQTAAFFAARARGGVGMIIVGGVIAAQRGYEEAPFKPLLRFDVDTFIPQFKRVADAVHAHDVPIIAELMPGFGRMGVPAPGRPIISASPINVVIPENRFPRGIHVPGGRTTPMPQEATLEEIKIYEDEMIAAAERVRRSGWDGVEVAAHMSYFLASFLSPRTNWRRDQYGGSVENRARILVNIVAGIRRVVGRDLTVGLRITANDHLPFSQAPEGFAAIAKTVEAAGLDYVALSSGCYETMDSSAPSEDGDMVDSGDARLFKMLLDVPVLLQGLHDPQRAARAMTEGDGDMVMLARPLLADPDYARKIVRRAPDTIVRCDRDNYCLRRLMFNMPIRCSVNPQMGRESRASGSVPPLARLLRFPIERAILALTGSRPIMTMIGRVFRKRAARKG